MTTAPSAIWQAVGTACVVLVWLGVTLSSPIHARLSRVRFIPPVVIVMVVAALVAGPAWLLLGKIPSKDDKLPNPVISPAEESGGYYLVVENRGGTATFHAEMEILRRPSAVFPNQRTVYPSYWEQGAGPKSEIVAGLRDRLLIGSAPGGSAAQSLYVYFFNTSTHDVGKLTEPIANPQSPPLIIFRVKISSVPAMKNGPFVHKYWLSSTFLDDAPEQ